MREWQEAEAATSDSLEDFKVVQLKLYGNAFELSTVGIIDSLLIPTVSESSLEGLCNPPAHSGSHYR